MGQYCRVEIPMLSVKSIRDAEPGMELEEAAFNREGRVIAEEGEVLTEERIEQFKNLNVRKVVTLTTETQWLPEEELRQLEREVSVLERKGFAEARDEILESLRKNDTVENIRKTALHLRRQARQAGDEEGVEYLDSLIDRAQTLQEDINTLQERLGTVEDEEAKTELLDALEGKIRELDETMLDLSAPDSLIRETFNTVREKEQLRHDLTEFVMNNSDIFQDGPQLIEVEEFHEVESHEASWTESLKHIGSGNIIDGVESLLQVVQQNSHLDNSLLQDFEELKVQLVKELQVKDELLNRLTEYDLDDEQFEVLSAVIEGKATLRKSELFDLPIPEDFARKTYEFMQDQLDCRHRLWEKADQVSGGELSETMNKSKFIDKSLRTDRESKTPGSSEGTFLSSDDEKTLSANLSDEALNDVVELLRDEETDGGINQLLESLENSERASAEDLEVIRKTKHRLDSLQRQKNSLETLVRESVENGEVQDRILKILRGEDEFVREEFMTIDAPNDVLEQVVDHLLDRMAVRRDLWNYVEELSEDTGDLAQRANASRTDLEDEMDDVLSSGESQSSAPEEGEETAEADRTPEPESFRELVQNHDPYEVAQRVDPDLSTVKNAKKLLQPPSSLNGVQKQFCDPLIDEAHKIFYGRTMDDDRLEQVAFSLADQLADNKRPLKVLLKAPSGDRYLLSHGINTCLVTMRLADYYDLDGSELLDLTAASLALDFGMVEIPMGLWVKDETLSRRADEEVKKHPLLSRRIVEAAVNGDDVVKDLVKQHHERTDGSGYPEGLEGDEQHPLAPLLGVADAYVAMMEDRPYREGKPPDVALKSLLAERERYDTDAINALVKQFGIYPDGCVVLLSDKRLALVNSQNPESPTNPSVLIITDTERNRLDSPVPEDLTRSDASIEKIVKR